MAVNLSPIGGVAAQFFDNNGDPLSGGKIYTYAAGTTTPATTYTSSTGATPHSNPIILDAAGRVPGGEIWLTDGLQYKFIIKTTTDVQIGSYDNIIGINSNFVNYTNSQEIQTATSGQTVFTLTTMQYQPGTNSLSVFVDGVNQYGPGALYAYQETSSTVVTFTSGLHVGAEVKFTTSAINASSYGDAEQISYTPPFTSSVATNVELKLSETVSVQDFGAVGDGVSDDTAAFNAAIDYATVNRKTLIVNCSLNLATWSVKTLTASLYLTGDQVGVVAGNGANLFSLSDTVSIYIADITVQNVGTALTLSATGDHPFIELNNVTYTSSGPVCNSGADEIQTIKIVNSRFTSISGEAVFKTNSYIKHALFSGNVFKSVTSATSALEVIRLGKTQYVDQPLTGNYVIANNLFDTMTANGGAAGEVHAIILYGDRTTITGNIIKDIDRPLARQSGGVEGIYTKVRSVAITGNVLVNAGFADGNKGAQINIKGDAFSGTSDPVGANSTVTGNVVYSTDAEVRNGIRVEGDNTTIVGNTLVGINGSHAIALAWSPVTSRNALIANNNICKPNITAASIWINAVGENIAIDGNVIEANTSAGAYVGITYTDASRVSGSVDKLRITNNVIDATGIEYGVFVLATSRTMTNLVINENHIKGGSYGVRAISTTYITSGEVRRNYFNGTTNTYRDKSTLTLRYSDNFNDAVPQDTWAAAPTVGTWAVGDIAYASSPAALGFIGWVCTVAGTPGTWKTFGAVTP